MKEGLPTVGDLFCGAGGFSEGFRQAGFKISWAIDDWEPATTTFKRNFEDAEVRRMDILQMEDDDFRALGKVDVLIGGPPCTFFSLANRGGNGDSTEGLALVGKFLQAVRAIDPDYWVMENVPNLRAVFHRLEARGLSPFSLKSGHDFGTMVELRAEEFGVPQKRHRLFTGRFPIPTPIETAPIAMRSVIMGLPYPLGKHHPKEVEDPLYPGLVIPTEKLTDHFSMDTRLNPQEIETCKRDKRSHGWYGAMEFPDDLDRPSRTIGATSTRSGRHTIVFKDPRSRGPYRTLTLRESASLQGFPIVFQFWDDRLAEKHRLVGNAVPPPLARSVALAIRKKLGLTSPEAPSFGLPGNLPPPITQEYRPTSSFPLMRTYREFVRGTLAYSRVELDNKGLTPHLHPAGSSAHIVEWRCMLYLGYAKDYMSFHLDYKTAYAIAEEVFASSLNGSVSSTQVDSFVRRAYRDFSKVPDASTLQAIWAHRLTGRINPDWIVRKTAQISRDIVGRQVSDKSGIPAEVISPLLRGLESKGGKEADKLRWQRKMIDEYTACAALILTVAATIANESPKWLAANWGRHYSGAPLAIPESKPGVLTRIRKRELLALTFPSPRRGWQTRIDSH